MFGLVLALVAHIAICLGSLTLACLINAEFHFNPEEIRLWQNCLPLVLLVRATSFVGFDEWLRRHRHTVWNDLISILATVTFGSGILGIAHWAGLLDHGPKGTVYLLDWFLTILGMGLNRATIRIEASHLNRRKTNRSNKRTIVYGTDQKALSLVRAVSSANPDFEIVALIERTGKPASTTIAQLPAVELKRAVPSIARHFDAGTLAIPDDVPGSLVRKFAQQCQNGRVNLKVFSDVGEVDSGKVIPKLRELNLADLYRSESIPSDKSTSSCNLAEKTILIAGAAGSIGTEFCRQILKLKPKQLILVDQSECGIRRIERELASRTDDDTDLITVITDINDQVTLGRAFADYLPDAVIHAAAYCNVALMERNVCTAVRNNILGTRSIVDLADRFGIDRFLMVSSHAATNPTDIIGATDQIRERYVRGVAATSKTHFVTARVGQMLDSAGNITNAFRQQIAAGGPILVESADSVITAVTIPDAVKAILESSVSAKSGQVITLDEGQPINLSELAKNLIGLSKFRFPDEIDIVFSGVRSADHAVNSLSTAVPTIVNSADQDVDSTASESNRARQIKLQLQQLERASHGNSKEVRDAIRAAVPEYSFDQGGDMAHRKASLSKALALRVA